jgi:hypothetical protein
MMRHTLAPAQYWQLKAAAEASATLQERLNTAARNLQEGQAKVRALLQQNGLSVLVNHQFVDEACMLINDLPEPKPSDPPSAGPSDGAAPGSAPMPTPDGGSAASPSDELRARLDAAMPNSVERLGGR